MLMVPPLDSERGGLERCDQQNDENIRVFFVEKKEFYQILETFSDFHIKKINKIIKKKYKFFRTVF